MDGKMYLQGLVLFAVGFTSVTLFLCLLYLVVSLSAKIVPRFSYLLPDDPPKGNPQEKKPVISSRDERIAVAIAVAMARKNAAK